MTELSDPQTSNSGVIFIGVLRREVFKPAPETETHQQQDQVTVWAATAPGFNRPWASHQEYYNH